MMNDPLVFETVRTGTVILGIIWVYLLIDKRLYDIGQKEKASSAVLSNGDIEDIFKEDMKYNPSEMNNIVNDMAGEDIYSSMGAASETSATGIIIDRDVKTTSKDTISKSKGKRGRPKRKHQKVPPSKTL